MKKESFTALMADILRILVLKTKKTFALEKRDSIPFEEYRSRPVL